MAGICKIKGQRRDDLRGYFGVVSGLFEVRRVWHEVGSAEREARATAAVTVQHT